MKDDRAHGTRIHEYPDRLSDPSGSAPGDLQRVSASVAAALRRSHGGPELLLIERATRAGDPWSGQLAFPGGRREHHDRDDRATAERETSEEIGLDLAPARWLTRLETISGRRATGRRLEVSAHVYDLELWQGELRPNEEVADAFWVPLHELIDPDAAIRYRYPRMPLTTFDGIRVRGDRVLWGMTLRFVRDLFARLEVDLPRP